MKRVTQPIPDVGQRTRKVVPCLDHPALVGGCWVGRCAACTQPMHKPVGKGGRPPVTCSDACRKTKQRGAHLLFDVPEPSRNPPTSRNLRAVPEPVTEPEQEPP